MTAAELARSLLGRKFSGGWLARCPSHDDRMPSLSLSTGKNGKILVHCHAGCSQVQVIDALRDRGLWYRWGRRPGRSRAARADDLKSAPKERDDAYRSEYALRIWRAALPASNTLAESYLRSRGLAIPFTPSIRFHPRLKHPSGTVWPAIVALVTRGADGSALGIHRTFLARDGGGKAPVDPQKMMLGPCRGGAVRLAEPDVILMVGEGIETCFAAMQASGIPAWAALSTSGLRSLDLPHVVTEVIVLADGDDPGEAAARDCALRWTSQGRRARIARPPDGMDFNDLLTRHAPHIEEVLRWPT